MKCLECKRCGSQELSEIENYVVCEYCQSRFVLEADKQSRKATTIDVQADIKALLKKCSEDPVNRLRYAHLILDIDPSNCEAMRYLT